jgi:tetratricopeptide (TPR) repeat protein
MMTRDGRKKVWILIAAIFLFAAVLSEVLRPQHDQYMMAMAAKNPEDYRDPEGRRTALRDTPFQTLAATLLGVREVLASLMWVRADDYFHRGEYRPIIAMVKQITAIDPHQIDVYATGAWHMAYNFMDKRLIEDGIKFLEEGCRNNDSVYDLYFELGYMHYDKTKYYDKSVEAYRIGASRGTTSGRKIAPSYVRHQLAHAIEKMGDIDQAVAQWEENLAIGRRLEAEDQEKVYVAGPNVEAAKHNLYITQRRRNERLAAVAEREKNRAEALRLWQMNLDLANAWLREHPGHGSVTTDLKTAVNQVERLRAGKVVPLAQTDLNFHFTVTRTAPRKLLVEGTCEALDLSRVHIRFRDKDYERRVRDGGFNFKMDNCTLEWDNIPINKGRFKHTIDLDRDPADMGRHPSEIYPLRADEFELSVMYNPRLQPAFIQDRYGWNGEGLTASPDCLEFDEEHAGIINGKRYTLRLVRKSAILKRDQVTGQGKEVLVRS